jgi:hypothetical protein
MGDMMLGIIVFATIASIIAAITRGQGGKGL